MCKNCFLKSHLNIFIFNDGSTIPFSLSKIFDKKNNYLSKTLLFNFKNMLLRVVEEQTKSLFVQVILLDVATGRIL